ncbi:MAG: hypothetical protein Fur003_2190 [Candidatus Dojkabacteria bacterium]
MATIRQKRAVEKLSENIRNPKSNRKSLGSILKDSGYSESVCKAPQRVTESKGWSELMSKYFPEEYLLKIHKKLLNKKETISYKGNYIQTDQPHTDVKYALEMIYKLKGLFKEVEGLSQRDVDELKQIKKEQEEFEEQTDEELEERLERLKKERRYYLIKEEKRRKAQLKKNS